MYPSMINFEARHGHPHFAPIAHRNGLSVALEARFAPNSVANHSEGMPPSLCGASAFILSFEASAAPVKSKMPRRYARYALETKLQVVEVARRGGVWVETTEHLGVNYHTARV
ncbi:hypothetical protein PC123_g8736 [Phytophthora cactorum]|nr:hypothetical protein PC123_g8736 [Phytophthora cactorum]